MKLLFLIGCILWFMPLNANSDEWGNRAMYVSVVQDPVVVESRKEISRLIDFASEANIKILFIQIYRANQAWFPSQFADSSVYKKAKQNINDDPLALIINEAHAKGIQMHAWLNLLSLGANSNAPILKKYGLEILTKNLDQKNSIEDYKIDNQYFLEPGDPRVQGELSNIVEEILTAYPNLDGIQFDYIRYPDVKPHYGYTDINMQRFKQATGLVLINEDDVRWKQWKRAQVTALVTLLTQKSRALVPNIQVSTTGCMPLVRAYEEAFQDWPAWVDGGLVDSVTLMHYEPDLIEFERAIQLIKNKINNFDKIKIAIGAYKFVDKPKAFEEEFNICQRLSSGCVIFNYGSLRQDETLGQFLIGTPEL